MSVRTFVGTRQAMKAKNRIELVLKVVTSPVWVPLWVVSSVFFYISDVIETHILNGWFDDFVDKASSWIAVRFFNK